MITMFYCVPKRKRRTYEVSSPVDETAILVAASSDAYLRGDMDQETLWAVHNITGREDPRAWLRLSRSESQRLLNAEGYGAVEKPIFSWQSDEALGEGYNVLRTADSRRFVDFLMRAGDENWPAPRIKRDVKSRLQFPPDATPRFRDVNLTRELTRQVKRPRNRFARPCALRYFG
jgi:hypothetical protein